MIMEPLAEPSSYFPCIQCQQLSQFGIYNEKKCALERYYNTFILKKPSGLGKKDLKKSRRESVDSVARVYPSIASIAPGATTSEVMFDHLTGITRHIEGEKVLQRYKGRETELTLKIQVPWTLFGPCMEENLMAYNESRDYRVTIKNTDRDCHKIRSKILRDGFMCVNPGMKLYFRAKSHADFSLDVYLNQTSFQHW